MSENSKISILGLQLCHIIYLSIRKILAINYLGTCLKLNFNKLSYSKK